MYINVVSLESPSSGNNSIINIVQMQTCVEEMFLEETPSIT